jgi:hypothetical protein
MSTIGITMIPANKIKTTKTNHREQERLAMLERSVRTLIDLIMKIQADETIHSTRHEGGLRECHRTLKIFCQTRDISKRKYDCTSPQYFKLYEFMFAEEEKRHYKNANRLPSKKEFIAKMRIMCRENYRSLIELISFMYVK